MKLKTFILLIISLLSFTSKAQNSTSNQLDNSKIQLDLKKVQNDLEILQNHVKEVRRDELNYKIEKDLLRDTFSNYYDLIGLIITIILGIFSIIGFIGIRDISSIKKEYLDELNRLKQIQSQFNSQAESFQKEQNKLSGELTEIIKTSEEQNKKIKIIELREKIHTLVNDDKLFSALEYTNAVLHLEPDNLDILNEKGRILCKLGDINECITTFEKALEIDPNDETTITNITEIYFLGNYIEKGKNMLLKHKTIFNQKKYTELHDFFEIIELYHNEDKNKFINKIKAIAELRPLDIEEKLISGWDFSEAIEFFLYQEENELIGDLEDVLEYYEGKISGHELYERLGILENK